MADLLSEVTQDGVAGLALLAGCSMMKFGVPIVL
jgi:hypothetical protein